MRAGIDPLHLMIDIDPSNNMLPIRQDWRWALRRAVWRIMIIETGSVGAAIVIGLGATLSMDLWNLFLRQAFTIPSLNYCFLGRWIRHMPDRVFTHGNISASQPKPHECAVGWVAHYSIGIAFALAFLLIAPSRWLEQPTLLPALLFGIGTVVLPLFVLQPSIGLGVAASRTANPGRARLKSLATHTVFGVGLYVCAIALRFVWPWLR